MMKSKLRYFITATMCVCSIFLYSCDKAFDNLKLDHLWRLDSINYGGDDIPVTDIYYGFAANTVEIHKADSYHYMGKVFNIEDSLKLDFGPYFNNPSYDSLQVISKLKSYGIDSIVETFAVKTLDRNRLVLSNRAKTLSFTRW